MRPRLLITIATLWEYANGRDIGIDQMLSAVPYEGAGDPAGRMAMGTAVTLPLDLSLSPKRLLTKIFEAFFTTKGVSGTGLGLWVSKEIIDRHSV